MYFTRNGHVQACCLNSNYALGNIKEHTIEEMWHGMPVKNLRNALSKNDLSMGCFGCKKRIESANFYATEAMKFDVFPFRNIYPVMFEFELSDGCNLNCIMCNNKQPESKNKIIDELYPESFLTQLDNFIPFLKKVKFIGGEPFFIPVYYKIWEKLIKINPDCLILVQTNATILNDKVKSLLNRGRFRVSISIDSFRKETYEKIRVNAHFESVMENLKFFTEYAAQNNYRLGIAVCPMQQNWKELPDIVNNCNKLNAQIFFNTVVEPENCSLYNLNINDLAHVIKQLENETLAEKRSIEKMNKKCFTSFLNQLKAWHNEKNKQHMLKCEKSKWWKENHDNIEETTFEEHLKSLTNYLGNYINSETGAINCKKKLKDYISHIEKLINNLNQFKYVKQWLVYLKEVPPHEICEILDTNDEQLINTKVDWLKQKLIDEITYTDVR